MEYAIPNKTAKEYSSNERNDSRRKDTAASKAAGLSQEQLAEQLDVSRQSVSKWELNDAAPKYQDNRIERAFRHIHRRAFEGG
ncbi:MAG: helix-turn-helix transcriptional regulator [Christensenellales bacterium]